MPSPVPPFRAALAPYIPHARIQQTDRIDVSAGPAVAYDAIRHANLDVFPHYDIVATHLHGAPIETGHATLDALGDFQLLADEPIAIGVIGKLWRPHLEPRHVFPDRFDAFDEPGYGKVAWSVAVAPRPHGSTIALDWRMTATDEHSLALLRRHWMWAGPIGHAIRRTFLSRLARELGFAIDMVRRRDTTAALCAF